MEQEVIGPEQVGRTVAAPLFCACSKAHEILSAEWLLTWCRFPNGGTVILLRACWSATLIFIVVLLVWNVLDPRRSFEFSSVELRLQFISTAKWFAAIFAGVYTALYARFASQWSYLAGVYNQIKAAECRAIDNVDALLEWKVGFIEDAEALHLASKPSFASVIRSWASDPKVKDQFVEDVHDAESRYQRLMEEVEKALR